MEFIIDFFMGIDGVLYYVMAVVNLILIFAIIGYLAERNEKEMLRLARENAPVPTAPSTPLKNEVRRPSVSIPVMAPTQASSTVNVTHVPNNGGGMNNSVSPNIVSPQVNPSQAGPSNNIFVQPNNTVPQGAGISDNAVISEQQKAPAVLVIESKDMN